MMNNDDRADSSDRVPKVRLRVVLNLAPDKGFAGQDSKVPLVADGSVLAGIPHSGAADYPDMVRLRGSGLMGRIHSVELGIGYV